jgi:hypothetical protein
LKDGKQWTWLAIQNAIFLLRITNKLLSPETVSKKLNKINIKREQKGRKEINPLLETFLVDKELKDIFTSVLKDKTTKKMYKNFIKTEKNALQADLDDDGQIKFLQYP